MFFKTRHRRSHCGLLPHHKSLFNRLFEKPHLNDFILLPGLLAAITGGNAKRMGTALLPFGLILIVWLEAAAPAKASWIAQGEWLHLSGNHPFPPHLRIGVTHHFLISSVKLYLHWSFGVEEFYVWHFCFEAIGRFYPITVRKEARRCSRPGGRRVSPDRHEASSSSQVTESWAPPWEATLPSCFTSMRWVTSGADSLPRINYHNRC